ncbi:unnamed protein product, partial [Didymodactylos carnosus]
IMAKHSKQTKKFLRLVQNHDCDEVDRLFENIYYSSNKNLLPPVHVLTSDDDKNRLTSDKCSICLEDFQCDDKIRTLLCHHSFHSVCIGKWSNIDQPCPYCRQKPIIDINAYDQDGFTALHLACLQKQEKLVDVLIKWHANLNLRNKLKFIKPLEETPLIIAAIYNHFNIVEKLLMNGAKADCCDIHGYTALTRAKQGKYVSLDPEHGIENNKKLIKLIENALEEQNNEHSHLIKHADKLRELGNECFRNGKYFEALEHYIKSVELNENDYRIYSNMAACYLSLKQYQKALDSSIKCTKLNPTFAKGYYRQAKAYMGRRDFPRAKMVCEKGLKHCDSNDTQELQKLVDLFIERHVSDAIASPFSTESQYVCHQIEHCGMPYFLCSYCLRQISMDRKMDKECPHCACNPNGIGMGPKYAP